MRNTAERIQYTVQKTKGNEIFILLALITFAFNLRGPLTALSPIIGDLRIDLGISSTSVGMLTTIPILCFGLLTPFASAFIARFGVEFSILTTLGCVTLGTIIRSIGGFSFTLAGTLIIGIAMTIGNIVSLMVIARDFPNRLNMVTGVYTSALNVGTMLTSAFTAPLAAFFGWRIAIAFWIIFALAAGLLRGIVYLRSRSTAQLGSTVKLDHPVEKESTDSNLKNPPVLLANSRLKVWKRGFVWLLVVSFAVHLFIYYAITAWLPTYFRDSAGMNATTAGYVSSAFQILALVGAFGVPAIKSSSKVRNGTLLFWVGVCWLITPLGITYATGLWLLWALICGFATGGGFTIIFMIIVEQAQDLADNRQISSFVQGFAYTLSSLGPLVLGGMHQRFESWVPGFSLLAVLAVFIIVVGLALRVTRNEHN